MSGSNCREVPLQHLSRGDKCEALAWSGSFDRGLLAGKKEKLVFLDGPVEVPAEIVKAEFPSYRRKEGARIQLVITDKLEDAAVITIAAAPRDHVNRSAGIAAIFG